MTEEPERGMLFDLKGRKKRVIQVIYVMLAFVMAASLLVIGLPGGLNPFGSGSSVVSQDTADLATERAARIEEKLQQDPNSVRLQEELIRERIVAGNALVEVDGDSQVVGPEAIEQYNLAAAAWDEYLKDVEGLPDRGVSQQMANVFVSLVGGDPTDPGFAPNVKDAAEAQAFVVEAAESDFRKGDGPTPAALLVTLARYQLFSFEFGKAAKTRQRALAFADSPEVRKQIIRELDVAEKSAKEAERAVAKARKQARKEGGNSLEPPAGDFGDALLPSPSAP